MSNKIFTTKEFPSVRFQMHNNVQMESIDEQMKLVRRIIIDNMNNYLDELTKHIEQELW